MQKDYLQHSESETEPKTNGQLVCEGAAEMEYSVGQQLDKIRTLLVDDHDVMREGLRCLLELEEDIEVVGEASNGRDAILRSKELLPDIMIVDIEMPLLNGILVSKQVCELCPKTKIIILSMYTDEDFVKEALKIETVKGYLDKQGSGDELVKAVRAVHHGQSWISPTVSRYLASEYRKHVDNGRDATFGLTDRGVEILQLIAEGNSSKEIATKLSISKRTVDKHRQLIMDRLGVRDTAGLVRYAIAKKIIKI